MAMSQESGLKRDRRPSATGTPRIAAPTSVTKKIWRLTP